MHWHVCVDCEYLLQSLPSLICIWESGADEVRSCPSREWQSCLLHMYVAVLPPSHVSSRLASVSTFSSEFLTTVCHPLPMQSPQVDGSKGLCSSSQSSCSLSSSAAEAVAESLASVGIAIVVVVSTTTVQHVPEPTCPRTTGSTRKRKKIKTLLLLLLLQVRTT